jgi:dissimilatory sulfite reductase related protein
MSTTVETGFIADWTEPLAEEIARAHGIEELTDRHWEVIRFMRESYEATGAAPSVRALAKASGVPVKELYALFPKGPAKLAAAIAGVPKPHGCI